MTLACNTSLTSINLSFRASVFDCLFGPCSSRYPLASRHTPPDEGKGVVIHVFVVEKKNKIVVMGPSCLRLEGYV
jgi:hypothetical protein